MATLHGEFSTILHSRIQVISTIRQVIYVNFKFHMTWKVFVTGMAVATNAFSGRG